MSYGLDELNRGTFTSDPTILTLSASSAVLGAALPNGTYFMISDITCWFKLGATGGTATVSSNYLPAGVPVCIQVTDQTNNAFVAAISTGSGKLYIMSPK